MKHFLVIVTIFFVFISCDSNKGIQEETASKEHFTFAFLTDIHLQPELRATEGFKKAIAKVNELNPDFVITGGDLIMDALGVPFKASAACLSMAAYSKSPLPEPPAENNKFLPTCPLLLARPCGCFAPVEDNNRRLVSIA